MTYLEGLVTLQKKYAGRQEGVHDLTRGVYDTSEGVYGTIEGALTLEGVYDISEGLYGTVGGIYEFMIYLEEFMALQKGYLGRQTGVYDISRGFYGASEGAYAMIEESLCHAWRDL